MSGHRGYGDRDRYGPPPPRQPYRDHRDPRDSRDDRYRQSHHDQYGPPSRDPPYRPSSRRPSPPPPNSSSRHSSTGASDRDRYARPRSPGLNPFANHYDRHQSPPLSFARSYSDRDSIQDPRAGGGPLRLDPRARGTPQLDPRSGINSPVRGGDRRAAQSSAYADLDPPKAVPLPRPPSPPPASLLPQRDEFGREIKPRADNSDRAPLPPGRPASPTRSSRGASPSRLAEPVPSLFSRLNSPPTPPRRPTHHRTHSRESASASYPASKRARTDDRDHSSHHRGRQPSRSPRSPSPPPLRRRRPSEASSHGGSHRHGADRERDASPHRSKSKSRSRSPQNSRKAHNGHHARPSLDLRDRIAPPPGQGPPPRREPSREREVKRAKTIREDSGTPPLPPSRAPPPRQVSRSPRSPSDPESDGPGRRGPPPPAPRDRVQLGIKGASSAAPTVTPAAAEPAWNPPKGPAADRHRNGNQYGGRPPTGPRGSGRSDDQREPPPGRQGHALAPQSQAHSLANTPTGPRAATPTPPAMAGVPTGPRALRDKLLIDAPKGPKAKLVVAGAASIKAAGPHGPGGADAIPTGPRANSAVKKFFAAEDDDVEEAVPGRAWGRTGMSGAGEAARKARTMADEAARVAEAALLEAREAPPTGPSNVGSSRVDDGRDRARRERSPYGEWDRDRHPDRRPDPRGPPRSEREEWEAEQRYRDRYEYDRRYPDDYPPPRGYDYGPPGARSPYGAYDRFRDERGYPDERYGPRPPRDGWDYARERSPPPRGYYPDPRFPEDPYDRRSWGLRPDEYDYDRRDGPPPVLDPRNAQTGWGGWSGDGTPPRHPVQGDGPVEVDQLKDALTTPRESTSSGVVVPASGEPELVVREPTPEPVAIGPATNANGDLYEILVTVGEGTYGKVYKAKKVQTGELVALKRIKMEAERDGFPVTAAREIKLLQALRHPNVVDLKEMMVSRGHVYMVLGYMEFDLTGVLHNREINFTPAHLKSLMAQLLDGLGYCHRTGVLHRDLKGSNILIGRDGRLEIADFGLARFYAAGRGRDYTNRVITQWYKPPELLFGATVYGAEVDMWSAGCIFLELFAKRPVFQGADEIDQLDATFKLTGTPKVADWPELVDLPWYELVKPKKAIESVLRDTFAKPLTPDAMALSPGGLDVAEALLSLNPAGRPTAEECLKMAYFTTEEPRAQRPDMLAAVEGDFHEYESKRARRPQRPAA